MVRKYYLSSGKSWYKRNKILTIERSKKWRLENPGKMKVCRKNWTDKNKDKIREIARISYKLEKNKEKAARKQSRRRELGFHKISFPLDVPFDWHHVNERDVVAIQRDIHKAVSHICGDGKLEGVIG